MKFKEFRTGLTLRNNTTPERLFEEPCSEYKTAALDIINYGLSQINVTGFGGWDSIGEKLYSSVYGRIASSVDFQNNLTAETQNNVAIRFRRFENINSVVPGAIAAGQRGIILTNVDDCQIFWFNVTQTTVGSTGDVETLGILKGALEGVTSLFEVVTDATGKTGWVDCRAYGAMCFDVTNTGSQTQGSLQIETRRHPDGVSSLFSFSSANFIASSPVSRFQRSRSGSPSAASAGGRTVVDWLVDEAHSVRFVTLPITGQLTVRGVLKG